MSDVAARKLPREPGYFVLHSAPDASLSRLGAEVETKRGADHRQEPIEVVGKVGLRDLVMRKRELVVPWPGRRGSLDEAAPSSRGGNDGSENVA